MNSITPNIIWDILHYYEKENAIDLFMEYASSEQIIVKDLNLQIPIGDSMSALEMALDKYFSKKYELYEKKP